MLVYPSFGKSPNRIDPCQGIPFSRTHRHTRLSAVPVGPSGYLPVLLLVFARSKLIAFDFYKKLGNLERMPGMGVEVEVGVGVEGPVKELKSIRTRDEAVGFGLERAKGERLVEVSREMAVDVESSAFELCDGEARGTTGES